MRRNTRSEPKRLPKSVHLFGYDFPVLMVPKDEVDRDGEANIWGQYHALKGEVRIIKEAYPALQWTLLLHEVLHIVSSNMMHDRLREVDVEVLAASMFEFLVENGLLEVNE